MVTSVTLVAEQDQSDSCLQDYLNGCQTVFEFQPHTLVVSALVPAFDEPEHRFQSLVKGVFKRGLDKVSRTFESYGFEPYFCGVHLHYPEADQVFPDDTALYTGLLITEIKKFVEDGRFIRQATQQTVRRALKDAGIPLIFLKTDHVFGRGGCTIQPTL